MLLDKSALLKTLKALETFDTNASPFIAVQLVENQFPRFFRSSINGQIQSNEFDLMRTGNTYVSLSHFKDCLRVLEDKVELALDPNGVLKIASTDQSFDSEIRVHTVPPAQAGLKYHELGGVATRLSCTTFLGCDTSPFAAASPPMLVQGRLFISTKYGAVMWHGAADTLGSIQLQPREPFLKLITGNPAVQDLFITEKGYWGAMVSDMVICNYGHMLGREIFDAYAAPGVELTRFPAARLVQALHAAAGLCADQDKVDIRPKEGIVVRDRFGNDSKFSLGGGDGWHRFTAFGKTMKTIADALAQAKDEEAVLYDVPSFSNPTKRFRRGPWEVTFRIL
jgi:hypothetical protein